jgi:hypothetical protein
VKKRDRRIVERYARRVADEIGLRDWGVQFNWRSPAPDGDGGSVSWPEGRTEAVIRLSPSFRDFEPAEQRYVIVHELVHCHFAPMQDTVEEDLQPHLSRPTYDLYSRSFRRALEYGVDATAKALAAHMPLIDWSAA